MSSEASLSSFYQTQLAILAGFCVLTVVLERRATGKRAESEHSRTGSQAENGSAGTKRASAGALARQYLLVYGLVMCKPFKAGEMSPLR